MTRSSLTVMPSARPIRLTCSTAWSPRTSSWRRLYVHALNSYDYALIRVVPSVERGECLNVGVLLFCSTQRFLGVRIHLDQARLLALSPDLDLATVQQSLDDILQICERGPDADPLEQISHSARFLLP